MDDVKRLCDRLEASAIVASPLGRAAMREAAQALTLAQARIRELETALEPFANDWRAFPGCDPDGEPTKVTVADFKRARQAIKEAGE